MIPPRVAGLCGLAAPPLAFVLIFLAIHLNASWFSWTEHALSDLGSAQSSSPLVFDAGLISASLLELVLLTQIRRRARSRAGRAGFALLAAGILSLAGIGLFPSPTLPHLAFSVGFYSLTPLGLLLLGAGSLRTERGWALLSLGFALAAGAVWALPYPGRGIAIPEALSAGLMSAWAMVLGAQLLRGGATDGAKRPPAPASPEQKG
jgi:hypothetical membrane protein